MKYLALVSMLAACGASGGGGGGGLTMQRDCTLDIVVTGGYEWATAETDADALLCEELDDGDFGFGLDVEAIGPGDGVIRAVHLEFAPPLQPGETGVVGTTVQVWVQDATVEYAQWSSATNTCEFAIGINEMFDIDRYVIGGTVSCGDLLLSPTEPTYPPHIVVDEFEFQARERLD